MSGTLLAFDFGTKSIGVAVGQRITGTARPLTALKANDGTPDWNLIERLLKEWQPDDVIVGPAEYGWHRTAAYRPARKFANKIHGRFGVSVKLHDERLSTVEARAACLSTAASGRSTKAAWTPLLPSSSSKAISNRAFTQGPTAAPAPVSPPGSGQSSAFLPADRFE
jgi:putative Holliday junction resolvase